MTPNINEKISQLNQWLVQADMEMFAYDTQIRLSEASSGNDQVDTHFQTAADNARIGLLATQRKIEVYKELLAMLQSELPS